MIVQYPRARRLAEIGLLLLLFLAQGFPLLADPSAFRADSSLRAAIQEARWRDALRVFSRIPDRGPADHYLAGVAHLRLHQPERAGKEILRAKVLGFTGWNGWPKPEEFLRQIDTVEEVLPPLRSGKGASSEGTIAVNAGPPTAWSGPVLEAVPEFSAVGQRIFGSDLPPVRLVLFAERQTYERFFPAMFGVPIPTDWQDGTGNLNIVVFCEKDRKGKPRPAGNPEEIGNVLHEFGHAWTASYLMNRHNKEWLGESLRRPWLDEGLADYVASLREPAYLQRRKTWIVSDKVTGSIPPPSFEELTGYRTFYEHGDIHAHYWLSALLVGEILGDGRRGAPLIPRLLDSLAASGNHEAAVRSVTGKDPRIEYERLSRRLWGSRP